MAALALTLGAVFTQGTSQSTALDTVAASFFGMSTTSLAYFRPFVHVDFERDRLGALAFASNALASTIVLAILVCSPLLTPFVDRYHALVLVGALFAGTASLLPAANPAVLDAASWMAREKNVRTRILSRTLPRIWVPLTGTFLLYLSTSVLTRALPNEVSSFAIAVPQMGLEMPDPTSTTFLLLMIVACSCASALLSMRPKCLHARSTCYLVFHGIATFCVLFAFFSNGFVDIVGTMQASMFLFLVCCYAFTYHLLDVSPFIDYMVDILFALALFVAFCIGFPSGIVLSNYVAANDSAAFALIIIAIILITQAPMFLFNNEDMSLDSLQESEEEPYLDACRKLCNRYDLSPRELDVLFLFAKGYSAPAIAESLYIAENTTKVHIRNIYQKLDIHSKQDLIYLVEKTASEDAAPEAVPSAQ